eukprot:1157659-Pelagomonas_calceolata.AAC.14
MADGDAVAEGGTAAKEEGEDAAAEGEVTVWMVEGEDLGGGEAGAVCGAAAEHREWELVLVLVVA